jgi:hypothetical protein
MIPLKKYHCSEKNHSRPTLIINNQNEIRKLKRKKGEKTEEEESGREEKNERKKKIINTNK